MNAQITLNPFVGLRTFESDESLLFFGRQDQTLELLQRLHEHHFVAVVGSSGSGKSSLIRAGLIPSLKAGYLVDDRDKWVITIMKPGQSPLYNLASSIIEQIEPGADDDSQIKMLLKKIREEGADAVLNVIQNLWKKKNTNFFLLVDQFEELFRFSMEQKDVKRKDEAIDFVNIILELSKQSTIPVYVVITMRSDFIGDCAQFYGLPEAMNRSQYLVPRLSRIQLKNAIEGPVKLYGRSINPSLTSKLLNDATSVKDELPLLQHVLMRVWDYEMNKDENGEFDLQDYEAIGGIERALSNHADEALKSMSDEELNLAKKIFQALTAIDENGRKIRRPAHLKELEAITGASKQQLLTIIYRFIEDKRSFLIINKSDEQEDEVIDISHESLIRQWNTLGDWVDEEGESAKNYLRLVESAELYKNKKKDLMTGSELQLTLQWYKEFKPGQVWAHRYNHFFSPSIEYLEKSENEWNLIQSRKKAAKRIRIVLIFGSFILAFILLAMGLKNKENKKNLYIANSLKEKADKARQDAEKERDKAVNEERRADSSTKIAILANLEAQKQKRIAESSALEALKQTRLATKALSEVNRLNDAFRLNTKAQEWLDKDPTTALRIEELALEKNPDPIFLKAAQQIYERNHFYHNTIVTDTVSLKYYQLFSNDNKKILIESGDSAKVWNVENGKNALLYSYKVSHNNTKFSPDLSKELIISKDSITVVNTITRNTIISFKNNSLVKSAYFTPYGNKIVVIGQDKTGSVWDIDGKKIVSDSLVTGASSSADDTKIFTESTKNYKGGFQCIYNLKNGTRTIREKTFTGKINHNFRLLPDGDNAVINIDSTVYFWNMIADTMQPLKTSATVSRVIFSPDALKVLVAPAKDSAWLWQKGKTRAFSIGGYLQSMLFSADGLRFLTLSDNTVKLWGTDGTLITTIEPPGVVQSVAFSSDGYKILTTLDNGKVEVWKTVRNDFIGNTNQINLVAYSPNGKNVLTGSVDGNIILWNVNGNIVQTLKENGEIPSVAFSPNGKQYLSACGNMVKLWNIDGTLAKTFYGHTKTVQSVAFSPNNKQIASGGDDSIVRLFELNDPYDTIGKIIGTHNQGVTAVVFSPDGTKILSGSRDFTAKLWNIQSDKLLQTFTHSDEIYCLAFSPDGTKIITGSVDKTAIIWTLDGKPLDTLKHNETIESATFSPDGTKILTGSWDYTAKLWSSNGKLLNTFEQPYGARVRSLAFSPDSKKIFVGTSDGIGRLYDIRTVQEFLKSDDIDALTEKQKRDFGINK